MTQPFRIAAVALTTILACSVAGAQMRGGVSSMRVASVRLAPSPRASIASSRGTRQVRVIQVSPSGRVNSGFSSYANSASYYSSNGVPGLGFDYTHLAAISGGLRNGRTSNSGRGAHRRQGTLIPIFIGGFPYYIDSSDYEQPQQQPQVVVVQQPVPVIQQADDSMSQPTISQAPPSAAPVRDVGEFVLVRRDGRILFASAFMVAGSQLNYVTPEGIRHTLPMTELDADATEQMNEARGTSVQIHN